MNVAENEISGTAKRPLGKLIAFTHSTDDPASRFRIGQYLPHLERAGWKVSLRPSRPSRPWQSPYRTPLVKSCHQRAGRVARRIRRLLDIHTASSFDVVWVNRDLLEANVRYEKLLIRRNPRVIFDFDDAIFLDGKEAHFKWICRHAAAVIAGNDALAQMAKPFAPNVTVIPTVVETDKYIQGQTELKECGPFRVGWLGSDRSIQFTLFPHLEMLARLQQRLGFEFVLVTSPRPTLPETALKWTFIPWSPSVETRIASLFDAGIMPLTDDEYQKFKCGCKILQYMAAGLPAVASPAGINSRLIDNGKRGFLASTEEEWFRALESLARDDALCRRFGSEGRAFVEKEYSLGAWLPALLDLLKTVALKESRSGSR